MPRCTPLQMRKNRIEIQPPEVPTVIEYRHERYGVTLHDVDFDDSEVEIYSAVIPEDGEVIVGKAMLVGIPIPEQQVLLSIYIDDLLFQSVTIGAGEHTMPMNGFPLNAGQAVCVKAYSDMPMTVHTIAISFAMRFRKDAV